MVSSCTGVRRQQLQADLDQLRPAVAGRPPVRRRRGGHGRSRRRPSPRAPAAAPPRRPPAAGAPAAACGRSAGPPPPRRRAAPRPSCRLCRSGVSLSESPTSTSTGTRASAASSLRLSCAPSAGRNSVNARTVEACMISRPGQHHRVGRVGAVEQLADQLLVPRVLRGQLLPQRLDDARGGQRRGEAPRGEPLAQPLGAGARRRLQVTGGGGDERDAAHPVAEQLRAAGRPGT